MRLRLIAGCAARVKLTRSAPERVPLWGHFSWGRRWRPRGEYPWDTARKKAADCMTLAAKASSDERRDMLRAMARSWATLANQMDRFEAT